MNAKQKFLTVTAVWIVISMILSFIDIAHPFSAAVSFVIVMLNRLLLLSAFIMLLSDGPKLFRRPSITGVAAYVVGIASAIVRFHINLQDIIHDGMPEQAFAAVSGISAFNMLYVLLGFFAYYRMARRSKKGSLLRISALVAAWWPLLSYMAFITASITHLPQMLIGMAGNFLDIYNILSSTIGHVSLAIWVLALRKELA